MSDNGVKITVTLDDASVQAAFARLERQLIPLALKNIGEVLLNSTLARFRNARDPDGNPWAPLNPLYAQSKRGPGILRERGGLMGSIVYQVSGDTVSIGSNKIYAAVHQCGAVIVPKSAKALHFMLGGHPVTAKRVTIPARPFLGIGAEDRVAIVDAVDEVVEVLSGGN